MKRSEMAVPSNALFCADCRDVLPTLAPDSIALSVWSPPYCVGKGYEAGVTYDEWANMLAEVLHLHARVLKPGGFCAVNIGDILCFADPDMPKIQAAKPRLALTRADVEAAQAAHPLAGRSELAAILGVSEQTIQRRLEHNNVRGGKQAAQTRMKLTGELIERPAHDAGLFLYDRRIWHKDPCWANSQWHTNSYRAVDEAEYVWILWKPGITPIRRDRLAPGEWAEWGSRGVWQIPSVRANDVHEAMFPVELPRRLIRLLTDVGDTVLDPFMGSGTSGVAAVAAGRSFIGVDKDDAAVDVARRRISDTQNPSHHDGAAPAPSVHGVVGRPNDLTKTANRPERETHMEKTLHNSDVSGARQNVPDIKVVGNGDMFRLLCKASSQNEGWMKSTKAMEVPGGCVVQVTTQQKNADGSYAVAEALAFIPGVKIADDENNGRKLVQA